MRYVSAGTSWALFACAVLLLIALGIAADRTTKNFADSTQWVSHTREVETNVEKIRADIYAAESGRLGYILSGTPEHRARYEIAKAEIPQQLMKLKNLTRDNRREQSRLNALSPVIDARLALLDESLALRQSGQADRERQDQITRAGLQKSSEAMTLLDQMKNEEGELLERRSSISEETYARTRTVLGVAFAAVVLLFFANFWQLRTELRDRKRAEASVRRLSGRILQLQDAERRKVARELHDSIGQYFAGLKMSMNMLQANNLEPAKKAKLYEQCLELLEQGMAETRTLSHLLHPPLLDEVGFASAASWFVDGFSQRSKINVSLEVPEAMERLPREVELALFRVLQEGLTNVHRHSGSKSALVQVKVESVAASMAIHDYGKGIAQAMLDEFRRSSTGTGVGLAGMRERVVDLGGTLTLDSDGQGTCLRVEMPLRREKAVVDGDAGPAEKQEVREDKADRRIGSASGGLMLADA
jgi:signal transduction histidine kinase